MSDQALETAAPAVPGLGLDLVALLLAAGNPVRWKVLRLLATEGPLSVTVLAARKPTGRNIPCPSICKALRSVGAVVMVADTDGDGRKLFHAIPPGCLRDGVNGKEIDCGVCVLRLR